RRQINGLISGASGRKRVQPPDLEEIEVPFPDINIQQSIVDYWQGAARDVYAARDAVTAPVRLLNKQLFDVYRNTIRWDVIHSRFFVLEFKDLLAWDAKSGRAASFRLACPSFQPMGDFIEEATDLVRPADEPEKDWRVYGVKQGRRLPEFTPEGCGVQLTVQADSEGLVFSQSHPLQRWLPRHRAGRAH
ncbi:MAG TPA: hypothetical protein VLE46_01240, partial [Nitrospira sp.]|nr:hypothetical protein [Nitrospira sp.]